MNYNIKKSVVANSYNDQFLTYISLIYIEWRISNYSFLKIILLHLRIL